MTLPLKPPVKPQLALSRRELPEGEGYSYEVKLDGFRCLAFVDGDEVFLQSRNGRPLGRYFPELALPRGRYVLDGEIVVRGDDGREDFDVLGQRIHPATSRIERLAVETPAVYVAFDLLAREHEPLLARSFDERRAALQSLLAQAQFDAAPLELIESVAAVADARHWLAHAEGTIAKERGAPYRPGERKGMVKVKRVRTIDAVVVGWRPGKEPDTVGALILGLYDEHRRDDASTDVGGGTGMGSGTRAGAGTRAGGEAQLRVVGHCSGLTAKDKRRLVAFLAAYATGERGTAEPSRWSGGRDLHWVALRPELVVEIDFDHVSAGRIRHGAKLRRWRDDKNPRECTYDQLQQ